MFRYLISSLKSKACSFKAENLTHKSLQSTGNFPHSFFFSRSSLLSKTNAQYFSMTLTASFFCLYRRALFLFSSINLYYASFLLFSFIWIINLLLCFIILHRDYISKADLILRKANLTLNPLKTLWIRFMRMIIVLNSRWCILLLKNAYSYIALVFLVLNLIRCYNILKSD